MVNKNDNVLGVEEVGEKIDEKGWVKLIDFREIEPGGVKAEKIIKILRRLK